VLQIDCQITEDVDQLQAFSQPNSVLDHGLLIKGQLRKQVASTDSGPETAHTTGYAPSVIVEFLIGLEGSDLSLPNVAEPLEIQFLASADRVQDHPYIIGIGRVRFAEEVQRLLDA
jgi:hypothetical protein